MLDQLYICKMPRVEDFLEIENTKAFPSKGAEEGQ